MLSPTLWTHESLRPLPRRTRCVHVRAATALVGRDAAEALSRGSDDGSRKPVVRCFLFTWLGPSSSKPDSTPCCRLCLLLSSRSFPKKASCTRQHRALVNSQSWHFSSTAGRFSFLDVALGKRITSHGRSSAHIDGPWETETRRCWPQFCASTYHPQNHSYPRVIHYPQRHVTAAPCCTETLKARHVAISIIH